ncbi:MAG TPA: thioredoxin domain-containing protein [Polyangiaceae bacterium]|jgi:protein-disulfide isomerase
MSKENQDADKSSASLSGEPTGINSGVAIIGFILCFLAGGMLMWGYDQKRIRQGEIGADIAEGGDWTDNDSPIPVSSKDPMWGSRTAPVTIVHFSDFQCPFCSRVDPALQQVRKEYGPDKVRIIWKNAPLPFHPNAHPAAEAAMGVFALKGNEAFWKFHDKAFGDQKDLSRASYDSWAKELGVDMAKFDAGLDAHTWAKKVDEDNDLGHKVGVNGTPASFVNGVDVSGAQPFEKFKAVIDQELQKAQAKLAAGTAKDKIYDVMSSENKKNAPAAKEDEGEKEDTKTVFKVPLDKSPARGGANALVTIVEFSDFQCPYCKRVEPTLKALRDKYGDKIRLVWKNEPLPFHPRAEPAAEVALEARAEKGDAGFWAAHDKLFDIQPKLDDQDLENAAKDLGLDVQKVDAAIKTHKWKSVLDDDTDESEDFQASGTPHFFIDGRRLVGAQPQDKFEAIIDEEIKKAQDLLAHGTKPDQIYETLTKDGKGPAALEKKDVALPQNAPWKGNKNAKVVIQEFSDFQCPYCKRVEDTVAEVMKNYGDKVKFYWRNFPLDFHQDAPLAAEAAVEAFHQKGSDGFWKMHDRMYAAQGTPAGIKRDNLEKIAQDIGLDMTKFKAALDGNTHKAEIDADTAAGKAAGVSGTPAFFINGYFLSGAQPYPKFRKLIEKALAEAH